MGEQSIADARRILHENRVPMLDYPEKTGRVCNGLWQYAQIRNRQQSDQDTRVPIVDKVAVEKFFAGRPHQKVFGEVEARQVLASYGLPLVTGILAESKEQALKAAGQLGFPLVLKIASVEFLHKSDVKGIAVGLKNEADVAQAWDEIIQKAEQANPKAVIQGCMVEQMAKSGREVILGMKRDPNFGALMMFGLGGIFVELYQDVAFRVAPLTRLDALEMIHETRAGVLLNGFRGEPQADLDGIVDCLLRLSQLATDFPSITEMEINPLVVYPKNEGVLALDCRILLE